MDQANSLRRLAEKSRLQRVPRRTEPLRTIAITSGKGGVGKTNVVVNLAMAMSRLGRKVLVIDADLGLANVDVVLGLTPRFTIRDVLTGAKAVDEVVIQGPDDIMILPSASGVAELSNLTRDEKLLLLQELDGMATEADVILIDTSAGINDTVLYFNTAAQDRLVVATGEPTSLTDAYALIKVLYTQHQERRFKLLVNNVADIAEAKRVYRKLTTATDHFLGGLSIEYLGFLPTDHAVHQAVMLQKPVLEAFPQAAVSKQFLALAKDLLEAPPDETSGNIKFFWRRLVAMA
ncbi:MAG: MinD/ParA family protein [Deltaproteobacteria bacterium]|nr:MinD/ParA family protein [Deltaproteobacteria bacterium]